MLLYLKLTGISVVTALLCACGGGGGSAAAPATETSSSQLAASVKLTGYAGLSLAQAKVSNGTQTASLNKLLNWLTDAVFPKAYAQAAVQCNYDLLKLAGVSSDGTLAKLAVTTGEMTARPVSSTCMTEPSTSCSLQAAFTKMV